MTDVYRKGPIELRLGDYREVLADVEPDAVISDPPFSDRVHQGQRTGSRPRGGGGRKTTLTYEGIDRAWVSDFIARWAPAVRYWLVVFSDHQAQPWWEAEASEAGLYVFAPVIWLRKNATPRLAGDGPTSACDYLTVCRPRRPVRGERAGSRPGFYLFPGNNGRNGDHPGGKPLGPTRALVKDYSCPGDLICDPCAGGATTLIAAALEGRRAIGAEIDEGTFILACARIERESGAFEQAALRWHGPEKKRKQKQTGLFGD